MTVQTSSKDAMRRAFLRLSPTQRLAVLHRLGRFAPWEAQFDFTPPPRMPGETDGPPDFVGIGVQKAGTTWWFDLLVSHPGITTRADLHKERHFFDRFGIEPFGPADLRDYHGWFPRPEGLLIGEWTPDYFTLPWVPPLLRKAAPDTRLLLILRDPIDRLRSGIEHQQHSGLAADGATIADAVQRGLYDRALSTWLEHFPAEQLLILQHEKCLVDFDVQLESTFAFLGLDAHLAPDLERPHASARVPRAPLPAELRRRLVDLFAEDVESLAARVPHLDLALWPNFSYLTGETPPPDSPPEDGASSPTRRP
jgi:hypothetical protein